MAVLEEINIGEVSLNYDEYDINTCKTREELIDYAARTEADMYVKDGIKHPGPYVVPNELIKIVRSEGKGIDWDKEVTSLAKKYAEQRKNGTYKFMKMKENEVSLNYDEYDINTCKTREELIDYAARTEADLYVKDDIKHLGPYVVPDELIKLVRTEGKGIDWNKEVTSLAKKYAEQRKNGTYKFMNIKENEVSLDYDEYDINTCKTREELIDYAARTEADMYVKDDIKHPGPYVVPDELIKLVRTEGKGIDWDKEVTSLAKKYAEQRKNGTYQILRKKALNVKKEEKNEPKLEKTEKESKNNNSLKYDLYDSTTWDTLDKWIDVAARVRAQKLNINLYEGELDNKVLEWDRENPDMWERVAKLALEYKKQMKEGTYVPLEKIDVREESVDAPSINNVVSTLGEAKRELDVETPAVALSPVIEDYTPGDDTPTNTVNIVDLEQQYEKNVMGNTGFVQYDPNNKKTWNTYERFIDGMARDTAKTEGIAIYPVEMENQVIEWEKQHPDMWDEINKASLRYVNQFEIEQQMKDRQLSSWYDINNPQTWDTYGKVCDACAKIMVEGNSNLDLSYVLNVVSEMSKQYPNIMDDINKLRETYVSLEQGGRKR